MCCRHEARNGACACGYALPTALDSATELASNVDTAAATDGSFRLPPLSTAAFSAIPASYTCSVSRYVRLACNCATSVIVAGAPVGMPEPLGVMLEVAGAEVPPEPDGVPLEPHAATTTDMAAASMASRTILWCMVIPSRTEVTVARVRWEPV